MIIILENILFFNNYVYTCTKTVSMNSFPSSAYLYICMQFYFAIIFLLHSQCKPTKDCIAGAPSLSSGSTQR